MENSKFGFKIDKYIKQSFLDIENENLFSKLWIFCCPYLIVRNNNDFFKIPISGLEVVIHNLDGELIAYENTCPHLLNRIISKRHGNQAARCSYHGWTIRKKSNQSSNKESGLTVQIPLNKECMSIEQESVQINSFQVKVVSGLVFIADQSVSHSIEEQFPEDVLKMLISSMSDIDNEILISEFERDFNWKLIHENLRDPLHPTFVHQKSITKWVDMKIPDLKKARSEELDFSLMNGVEVSVSNSHYNEHDLTVEVDEYISSAIEPAQKEEKYMNWLLYPNTHISSANSGRTFLIESYLPINPCKSLILIFIFTRNRKKRMQKSYLQQVYRHAYTILDEDYTIVENLQNH